MSNSIDSDCSLWRISSLCSDVLRSCALRISSDVFHCLKMKCYMKASYLNCWIINKDKCNLLFWTKYNKKEKKKNNGLMVFLLINRFYPEFLKKCLLLMNSLQWNVAFRYGNISHGNGGNIILIVFRRHTLLKVCIAEPIKNLKSCICI